MKNESPMLEILKKYLPDGLDIAQIKDKASSSQMQIVFLYGGIRQVSWLYKTCAPGYETKICKQTIASAMMGIAIKLKDIKMAEYWQSEMFGA